MHSHVGKSSGSCMCSLITLIVQALNEAVSVQSREDLSALFLYLGRSMSQPEADPQHNENVIHSARSGFETSAQEMSYNLTPGQVQNSFLSGAKQTASHIPKVAGSGGNKGSS